ncbi:unnamed protein product [Schistosoma margrebowiei]|uniref:Uncharacterized protein n=1 Tax=Schistosoma margrebowiei TaxID=48269 RepID=A0A183LU34_9TREM|nr:unnamed protein product [Schistosoma margrebowiei]
MKTSTSEGNHGIQWTSRMQLDDLDFADDLVPLSQAQQQMQEKTNSVAAASAAVGLNIHKGKSKVLRYNTACTDPITIDGEDLEDVKFFTYLGSINDEQGGSVADVKARIGKARAAYLQLRNIWNSKQLSTKTKVRILNTNVKAVLLYWEETWRTTKAIIQKLQVFVNSCLRKILRIRWSDTISNKNYLLKTNYPSSPTVITSSLTSSSASSDWVKCQSPTPIKSNSSSTSSSSTTTTTMSSSHKWLNANDNIEHNKSKFVTMNKNHKYNFSKSTNNLLNHSNTLNNSSSISSGHLTPCQIQTTTNLNEERNYKSISENKINELDMQNRRFASAPLFPAPLLTGNIIRNRPVINITSTTTTATTTKSTGDIFNSTKLNSKSYLVSSNTGSSSVIRLHSSSELNNLFQDYRLRRTSKSTSIGESISPGCVSSNDIHTNNQRHTNIDNHHTTSLAQLYHPSHLRNDSMQPNFNEVHDQHNDLGKSSVKYKSTASTILDTATEASKNSKIQLSTGDSQVSESK